jgi:putative membrane protein insertion efficiency factor
VTQVLDQGNDTLSRSTAHNTIRALAGLPVKALVTLVHLYQMVFSSVLPGTCRFSPTCSCYAVTALKNHGVIHGSYLTVRRLIRCNPWGPWGHDPVPPVQ